MFTCLFISHSCRLIDVAALSDVRTIFAQNLEFQTFKCLNNLLWSAVQRRQIVLCCQDLLLYSRFKIEIQPVGPFPVTINLWARFH